VPADAICRRATPAEENMQSGNPALNKNTFLDVGNGAVLAHGGDAMTVNGTVNKTGFLLILVLVGAMYSWSQYAGPASVSGLMPLMFGGMIVGLVLAFATIFKKTWAPYTAPLYAVAEGVFIGALSAITEKFKLGVIAATGGILLLYLANFIMGFFGHSMDFINGNSTIAIGFSVVVVIVAALNLILDFDLIETGARANAPKYMEWYGAFALVVTLVWLYLEILRLLSKMQSRN